MTDDGVAGVAQAQGTLWTLMQGQPEGAKAIVVPDGPTLTYGQLRAQVRRTADALASYGLGRGDRIALVFPNGAEVIIAFLGAAIAAIAAPLNPGYTEDEFRFYLDDTAARALVVPPGGAEAARHAAAEGTIIIEAALDANGEMQFSSTAPRDPGRTAGEPDGDD